MADIEAALLPPPSPQERWDSVAATMRGLLAAAADIVVCSFVYALWVNAAANAVAIFSRWACGEDSPAAAVTMRVFMASFLAMGALVPFASPVLMWRLVRPHESREGGGGGGATKAQSPAAVQQRPRRYSTGARRRQEGGIGRVALLFMAFTGWVVVVGVLLRELAPEKGSCQERVGSVLN
ncbi:hypothetical protein E2562_013354 [Oryza meyeriana var. granulata]|uniref:Uncharacterized protein n=1 Tax=Oryza meyeriana var. granulata TaxID=110450 RepID=A0A6G1CG07_9ORYZ|nr:hypothetical protein E2562_013354 [Oryza meyeriana var. granulata]